MLTSLEATINGERVTFFDGAQIMHYTERDLREHIDERLEGIERVEHLTGELEIWAGGEIVDYARFEAEDFDAGEFWHVYWAAFRAAYEGLPA